MSVDDFSLLLSDLEKNAEQKASADDETVNEEDIMALINAVDSPANLVLESNDDPLFNCLAYRR